MRSKAVCSNTPYVTWVEKLKINYKVIAGLLMGLGLFILFLGSKFKSVFFLTLQLATFQIIFFTYVDPNVTMPFYGKQYNNLSLFIFIKFI